MFAAVGSQQLADGGPAHGHFNAAGQDRSLWQQGFCTAAGENQAPDWPALDIDATVDNILAAMMAERPPSDGHRKNILSAQFTRVGVSILVRGDHLWFTNDFSADCKVARFTRP